MFELAYETFDGGLIIYMTMGSLEELALELQTFDYIAFQKDQELVEGRDDGYFRIGPCTIKSC